MNSKEIRKKYINFVKKTGHAVVPSTSLIPENDPSTLFISSGVQAMIPYVMGENHPRGQLIANIQKCVRTQDIDEVGDATHDTFFEMMGYWSFGQYFKEQSIRQLYNFFVDEIGLEKSKIYVTCFEGDENSEKDIESAEIWKSLGIAENHIYFLSAKSNWWNVGDNGPCGPDTEVFYDVSGENLNLKTREDFLLADEKQQIVEIANSVFMTYKKENGKVVGNLKQKNVDMGSGFERVVMAAQGKNNIFDTDLFNDLMKEIQKNGKKNDLHSTRIIADHIRTATFLISDGVLPANTEQGYVLRRLIRRAVRYLSKLEIEKDISYFVDFAIKPYHEVYPELIISSENIKKVLSLESEKFNKTLLRGLKELNKYLKKNSTNNDSFVEINSREISGEKLFELFSTYGFPVELSLEEIEKISNKKITPDVKNIFISQFEQSIKKHKEISKIASEAKFKGGLAGTGDMETKYHTVTHLLHQALRDVLGNSVSQKGSNITSERLRFDFSYSEKMTDEQKNRVESIVNQKISESLDVKSVVLSKEQALKSGALHFFGDKYGDSVTIYFIGKDLESAYSKEFCGGPHIKNTSELGIFKIKKEESVSSGVRRIKAILE
ncbi:MAG TPA: alanine--tRNA ligase [Candidatus Paceibacterota bacterium]|nr:alanine--tRNA ligase [Candidatus Paceibacterota bacterium]